MKTPRNFSAAISAVVVSDSSTLLIRLERLFARHDGAVTVQSPATSRRVTTAVIRYDVVCIDRTAVPQLHREVKRWRRRWPSSQIVVVNALNHDDVCRALEAGADDALTATTPCFESRINALARRARTLNAGARVAIGDVVFDRESRRVWCAGSEVRMTPQECAVLDCFFWHDPEPVGLRTLTDFVWHGCASRDVVEVYVGYVRRKLAASKHVLLQTIRGRGYHFIHRSSARNVREISSSVV